ncbi:MAG: hypothetical protein N2203_04485 [Bacteroidia bacterium]|nr:hypothetical protein [Bacteroidia bacterium]
MLQKTIHLALLFMIISCNNEHSDNASVNLQTESITHTDSGIQPKDTVPAQQLFRQIGDNTIFIATGTEPGWILTLSNENFIFINNYGSDTIQGKFHSELKQFPVHVQSEKLSFDIDKKQCIAISGDTLPYSVKIYLQKNVLTGCGKMLK